MSNYRGHIAGASLFAGIYAGLIYVVYRINALAERLTWLEHVPLIIPVLILSILFGLWPDVDTNSKGQDIFYKLFFVFDIVLIIAGSYQAAAYFGVLAMLPIIGQHRGWTHTHWAMLVIPSPFLLIPYFGSATNKWAGAVYYGAAVFGYMSHMFFDGLLFKRPRFKLK